MQYMPADHLQDVKYTDGENNGFLKVQEDRKNWGKEDNKVKERNKQKGEKGRKREGKDRLAQK